MRPFGLTRPQVQRYQGRGIDPERRWIGQRGPFRQEAGQAGWGHQRGGGPVPVQGGHRVGQRRVAGHHGGERRASPGHEFLQGQPGRDFHARQRAFEGDGLEADDAWKLVTWAMIGGVLGAKLWYVGEAISRDPGLASKVGRCVIMGGAACVVGNVTPAAEYNIWCDPEAASSA